MNPKFILFLSIIICISSCSAGIYYSINFILDYFHSPLIVFLSSCLLAFSVGSIFIYPIKLLTMSFKTQNKGVVW